MRRIRPARHKAIFPLLLGCAVLATPRLAHAGDTYIETGFGVSQVRNSAALFEAPVPDVAGLGGAINLGFWWNVSADYSDFQIHLGLKDRIVTAHTESLQFILNVPYPALRFQVNHLYFGGGISPFVLKRQGTLFSINYQREMNALAYMVEVGALWKVVPFFHLAIETSVQSVGLQNLEISPKPAVDLTLQLRFFLGTSGGKAGGGGKRPKYDGWRYPFGIELN